MNNIIQLLQQESWLFMLSSGIIGLIIGSFLNVVIIRLPKILEKIYTRECQSFLALPHTTQSATFNLLFPRSHCPKCNHILAILENIPILSFIVLKGQCRHCRQPISCMYPFIELITCLLSMLLAWKFGVTYQTLAALIFLWVLITQASIDFRYLIIPDELTIPTLWLGLLLNCNNLFCSAIAAICGAIVGYLLLWVLYWLFKIFTGKDGIGYGDFKLLAMLGAWLGWQQLPCIIIIASFLGSIVGIGYVLTKKKSMSSAIPFGPYLAIAGLIALLYGNAINTWYLKYSGIALI